MGGKERTENEAKGGTGRQRAKEGEEPVRETERQRCRIKAESETKGINEEAREERRKTGKKINKEVTKGKPAKEETV